MTVSLISVMFAAVISQNIVLSQYQGICPFLGVSKKLSNAAGMGFAVIFVMAICVIAARAGLSLHDGIHTCLCEPRADAGDDPEEIFSDALQCAGRLSAVDHDQLCDFGNGKQRNRI